jgi:hypothetical protein
MEFDQRYFGRYPPPRSLVLHVVGFITFQMMGFDLKKKRPRDLTIGVALLGCYVLVELWLMTFIDD